MTNEEADRYLVLALDRLGETHSQTIREAVLEHYRALAKKADKPAATETEQSPPMCAMGDCRNMRLGSASVCREHMVHPPAEPEPQGAPPEPLDENWLSTRRPARWQVER